MVVAPYSTISILDGLWMASLQFTSRAQSRFYCFRISLFFSIVNINSMKRPPFFDGSAAIDVCSF